MGWQILHISQPAQLTLEHKQCSLFLVEKHEKVILPFDNLSAVIIESHAVTITSALLQAFSANQIAVFVCNETHLPNGILLPFMPYFAYSKVAHLQAAWTEPFKKQIWKRIVQAKIANQAYVLKRQFRDKEAKKMTSMAAYVQTGDIGNLEGQAAAFYWRTLFGNSFSREQKIFANAALNYGYAILRGMVARCLTGTGFVPCFGVHHCNQLNAFNLADDLLEPFRPLVDLQVLSLNKPENDTLSPHDKASILELLVKEYLFEQEQRSLLNICEIVTSSLMQATEQKDYRKLKLFLL